MKQENIRNIAIIAHVDHGKTTLVDELFQQSGMFRDNQEVAVRLMDSMDLERERGITIVSKNGSFQYADKLVNIIDTPGHADFGGQVERILRMADGAMLLVDAAEGPMPQTYFVLKKALALSLPVLVVINKVDKQAARPHWAVDQVFDLFGRLNAPDEILDFPVVFASATEGWSSLKENEKGKDMRPLMDKIVEFFPPPQGDAAGPLQLLVSSVDHSAYSGKLAIGKLTSGSLAINQEVAVAKDGKVVYTTKVSKLFRFVGNEKQPAENVICGDVAALAGMPDIEIGETITDPEKPLPLPGIKIDPPTISITFMANTSPFAGKEGKFVTSRHIKERLDREVLSDVALHVEPQPGSGGFKVSGRGELHLAILVEKMRREDYELQLTRPRVIFREEKGVKLEPFEELTLDVGEDMVGGVIECLGQRRGNLLGMLNSEGGMTRITYRVPTRGLLGFRSEFMTLTRGMGTMNYVFAEYGKYAGDIKHRVNGVLISMEAGKTTAYALDGLQPRGVLFIGPGEEVYVGQVIGEHNREADIKVNPCKGKKQTNMRSVSADDAAVLAPPKLMGLEDAMEFINDQEVVEVTPGAIRLRMA